MSNELHRKSSSFAALLYPRQRECVREETAVNVPRDRTANRRPDTNRPWRVADVDVEQNLWSDSRPAENSRELNRQSRVTCTRASRRTDVDGWSFVFLKEDQTSAGTNRKHVRTIISGEQDDKCYLSAAVGCHHGLAWQWWDNDIHRAMDRCEYVPNWHQRPARLLCSLWNEIVHVTSSSTSKVKENLIWKQKRLSKCQSEWSWRATAAVLPTRQAFKMEELIMHLQNNYPCLLWWQTVETGRSHENTLTMLAKAS